MIIDLFLWYPNRDEVRGGNKPREERTATMIAIGKDASMIMHKRCIASHDDERHEFVVTYEGPTHPSSSSTTSTTNSSSSSCSNRQAFCITLPPTGLDTSTGSSYVSNDDLLSSLSKKIGWPAFLLCIVQQGRNNSNIDDGASSSTSSNKLLFPTHSLQTKSISSFNDTAVTNIIYHQHAPLTITIAPSHTSIRGGKGGFGTLLKGQSKQAGARQTLDFGACRDLSGRRLRHVNDEIKLRKWKELQAARAKAAKDGNSDGGGGGGGVDELAALKTPSGIRNWHLMVPSWSDAASFSNKGKRKIERQYEREVRQWQSKEDRIKHAREQKRLDEEWAVMEYVRRGEEEGKRVMGGDVGKESVKEGILAHLRKKKLEQQQQKDDGEKKSEIDMETAASASGENNPAFLDDTNGENLLAANLMTLSGEMSVFDVLDSNNNGKASSTEEDCSTKLRIQSQSDFATAVVLLNADKLKDMSTANGIYIEFTIQTAGLAQIGWIRSPEGSSVTFLPNSDTGDGVGDDAASYGYDGSRGLKFHGGEEVAYGSSPMSAEKPIAWKSGDVLGCWCILSEKGVEIGYSLNGEDLGVAFTIANTGDKFAYYPAISLNLNEVVDVNVGPHFAHGIKEGCVGACELVKTGPNVDYEAGKDSNDDIMSSENDISKPIAVDDNAPPRKRPREALTSQSEINKEVKPSNIQISSAQPSKQSGGKETFDLNQCSSVTELKEMDPDRLKNILLQMGVKCG